MIRHVVLAALGEHPRPLGRQQLAQAQMDRFLGHMYNIPVYKIPQVGRPPHRHGGEASYAPHHELFDIAADPHQEHPIDDHEREAEWCAALRAHLRRVQALAEHLDRLGL